MRHVNILLQAQKINNNNMKYIKLFENFNIKYYHGSYDDLYVGTILEPHDLSYTKQADISKLEFTVEKYRPFDKLSRYDSVFLTDNIENLDNVGAPLDFIYEVIPEFVEKSDLAWYTEIEMVDDEEAQKECALNYWNGVPFHNRNSSAWEYRTPRAIIKELVEEN